jgi:hypothetical protein
MSTAVIIEAVAVIAVCCICSKIEAWGCLLEAGVAFLFIDDSTVEVTTALREVICHCAAMPQRLLSLNRHGYLSHAVVLVGLPQAAVGSLQASVVAAPQPALQHCSGHRSGTCVHLIQRCSMAGHWCWISS